jgi:hypothetical protein
MPLSTQNIKDRMMLTATRFWGLPETETDAGFDPLVALLMSACAEELQKINYEIESSRARVLERLVQLLSPEVLTGPLPAHAVAVALPAEDEAKASADDQFYTGGSSVSAFDNEIYFSPAGTFPLQKAVIKYRAAGNKLTAADDNISAEKILYTENKKALPPNQLWIGIVAKTLQLEGLRFYFDVVQQSHKKQFFAQLPRARWFTGTQQISFEPGYAVKKTASAYFDINAVLNRDISITEKTENYIKNFYQHQFITLGNAEQENNIAAVKGTPAVLENNFSKKELDTIEAQNLYWLCIHFPEDVGSDILEETLVYTNCFPVVNRHLHDINYRLKEFINIIPLLSEEIFLDIYQVTDQQGKAFHIRNQDEAAADDMTVLLRYGGVGRIDKRDAAEAVEKLVHLLREETAAFSVLGNDFLQNELTTLQQTINKLNQQLTSRHLLKGTTPYLVINNNTAAVKTLYVKFWSSNGDAANLIKAATPLNIYSNSHFESGTARLITATRGGRNKLNDTDKVLAYKSALLSKEKLVTNEDIAAFCRLRLAVSDMQVIIKKGTDVLAGRQQGFIRTIEVHIGLSFTELTLLQQKGSILFWQQDIAAAIEQCSNFFIPVKVFIKEVK